MKSRPGRALPDSSGIFAVNCHFTDKTNIRSSGSGRKIVAIPDPSVDRFSIVAQAENEKHPRNGRNVFCLPAANGSFSYSCRILNFKGDMMTGKRILTAAALATSALGLAAGAGLSSASAATGTGHSGSAQPMYTCNTGKSCTGEGLSGAVFHPTSGGASYSVVGDSITAQCWYTGGPGADGLWDHVIDINGNGAQGHVGDEYINFGGHTAEQLGLPECG
jgi:hypothetical protein